MNLGRARPGQLYGGTLRFLRAGTRATCTARVARGGCSGDATRYTLPAAFTRINVLRYARARARERARTGPRRGAIFRNDTLVITPRTVVIRGGSVLKYRLYRGVPSTESRACDRVIRRRCILHTYRSVASPAMASMVEAGYLVRRGLVAPPLLRSINALMRARAARVMAALGDRPIGLGSVNGYLLPIVLQSPVFLTTDHACRGNVYTVLKTVALCCCSPG